MRNLTLAATLGVFGLAVAAAAQTDPITRSVEDEWASHRSLKILYAGKADGQREKAFAEFLGRWFDTSSTIPLETLSMETAADYDVVIVDWVSQYGNDGYPKRERRLFGAPAKLGPDFTKPIVAMTYVGTQVRRGGKLDWF